MSQFQIPIIFFSICSFHITGPFASFAAAGTKDGGGGDAATEMRVNEIRKDILEWISEGGGKGLKLPQAISSEYYVTKMTETLIPHAVVVGAVSTKQEAETTDPEQKVVVDGQYKTCRGFTSVKDSLPHLLCNIERFAGTSESKQYRLIHHEYAGLAGVEQNVGASSDYEISDQITDFLIPKTVLRLSIKKYNPSAQLSDLLTNPNSYVTVIGDRLIADGHSFLGLSSDQVCYKMNLIFERLRSMSKIIRENEEYFKSHSGLSVIQQNVVIEQLMALTPGYCGAIGLTENAFGKPVERGNWADLEKNIGRIYNRALGIAAAVAGF